jgi:plasmid stabilization system protein ParE
MSLDYLITPEARGDIDEAHTWYESMTAGRGDEFLTELTEAIAPLRAAPEAHGRVRGQTRAAPLPDSNYVIYYRIEPNRIRILAVQHASADPRKWKRRK